MQRGVLLPSGHKILSYLRSKQINRLEKKKKRQTNQRCPFVVSIVVLIDNLADVPVSVLVSVAIAAVSKTNSLSS